MATDIKPNGELISHQLSVRFVKGDVDFNEEEFAKRLANFLTGFVDCYPHYISKDLDGNSETWTFKFWIEKPNGNHS